MPTPVRIFLLCSAKDRKLGLSEDLETHLSLLKRNDEIIIDSEATIGSGEELHAGLAAGIDRAEIILLLVSANLLATHADLVERALSRRRATAGKVRTIPILVRPFELEGSPLAALKPLPSEQPISAWRDEDEAWVVVVKGLRRVIEEVRTNRPASAPPARLQDSAAPPPKPSSEGERKVKKVLLVSANPSSQERIALTKEFHEIVARIERSKYRDQIEVVMEFEVRLTDLASKLAKHQPHVLIFSGHGAPEGSILLVDPDQANQTIPMPLDSLRSYLETLKDNLCCVVLNACYTATDEHVAQSLADVVGFAIGMNGALDDRAAVLFSSSLLEMLAMGRNMQDAFRVAKTQIASMNVPGRELPVLKSATGADASKFVLVP